MPLFVASSNPGKLRDFAAGAEKFGIAICPLPSLEEIEPPPEDGDTFTENAREKAIYYSRLAPDLMVVADDSGLEVDALHGAPGVYSARYAANEGVANPDHLSTDELNNQHLLAQLSSVPQEQRSARYRCVLATARNGTVLSTAEGSVEGLILLAARGTGGFGYDPLFLLPERGQTMAEIDLGTKQELSHRGRALHALLSKWPT